MKKIFYLLVCVMLAVGVSACRSTGEGTQSAEPESKTEEKAEVSYISKSDTAPDYLSYSVVGEYEGSILSDSSDDSVSLYVDAEYDDENRLVKNDMNRWVLSVRSGDTGEYYTLFDEKVSLGDVYFQLADFFEEGTPYSKIILYKNSSAELLVRSYRFEEGKGFAEENLYNSSEVSDSGVNLRFSTIPQN